MKHIKSVTKSPAKADDIPVSTLIDFVVAILDALSTMFAAKEETSS